MQRRSLNLSGRRGNASVEFALFVPVVLLLFLGTVEVATAFRTYAKLDAVVANVAQEVSVSQAVSSAAPDGSNEYSAPTSPYTSFTSGGQKVQTVSLPDLCYGAMLGTAPYPNNKMTLDIASVTLEPSAPGSSNLGATPDEWELDQTVSGGGCTTNAGATAILSNTSLLSTLAKTGSSAQMLVVPCDNVIIVQATLPYSGLFGLFFKSSFRLTQTAEARWAYAQPVTELMLCSSSGCQNPSPPQYCDSSDKT